MVKLENDLQNRFLFWPEYSSSTKEFVSWLHGFQILATWCIPGNTSRECISQSFTTTRYPLPPPQHTHKHTYPDRAGAMNFDTSHFVTNFAAPGNLCYHTQSHSLIKIKTLHFTLGNIIRGNRMVMQSKSINYGNSGHTCHISHWHYEVKSHRIWPINI